MNNLTSIIDQMIACGLPMLPSGHPVLDGRIHRFGPRKKAWYALREWTLKSGRCVVTGGFGIWQGENNNAIPVKIDWQGISAEEREQVARQQRELEAHEQAKRKKLADFAANRAKMQWDAVQPDNGAVSPYLQRKQVDAENVRIQPDGTLLVPMYHYKPDGVRLAGLQKIAPDGTKLFNRGMDKTGTAMILGDIPPSPRLIMIGEGYATMESVRMATGKKWPAVVAFDCGNLLPVAKWLRQRYPDTHLLFIADDDYRIEERYRKYIADNISPDAIPALDDAENRLTDTSGQPVSITAGWKKDEYGDRYIIADIVHNRRGRRQTFRNAGIYSARHAAAETGNASLVWPVFVDRDQNLWTDFNDLHVNESLEVVSKQLHKAIDSALSDKMDRTPPKEGKASAPQAGGRGPRGRKPKERGNQFWDKVNHLLQNFVLIYGTDEVYDRHKNIILKVQSLRIAYGNDAVKFWLNNGERQMVDRDNVVFDPAQTVSPETHVNLFHGWTVTPKPGSCRQIIMLLEHLCNDDPAVVDWILKWIAYPLKNPGAKMRTSILMHGDEGSGKNLFWENIVCQLYGEYGCVVGNDEIESQYNEWVSRKLFIVADEVVTRAELRNQKNKLKRLITGDTVQVNPKHLNARVEANRMNIVFLSNELQPLILDPSDRRYLVIWTPPKMEKQFYIDAAKEAQNGGIEAFYHYLLNEVDLDGFSEHSDPPVTDAKRDLISLGMSSPERFYMEWSRGFLPLPFISCSAQQLYSGFQRWCNLSGERYYPSQTNFGRAISRIGRGQIKKGAVKYEYQSDVKQRIVYMVGKNPENKTKSQWIEDASALFDSHLQKYRGFARANNE